MAKQDDRLPIVVLDGGFELDRSFARSIKVCDRDVFGDILWCSLYRNIESICMRPISF
jgi:hypothetical protein